MTRADRRGMSLVEVIVALAILGVGVLGASAVALHAASSLRRARATEAAVLAATTMLDSLRQRAGVEPGERRIGRVSVRWTTRSDTAGAVRIDVVASYPDGVRARRLELSTLHLPPPEILEDVR